LGFNWVLSAFVKPVNEKAVQTDLGKLFHKPGAGRVKTFLEAE